jgi:hypothetical protein
MAPGWQRQGRIGPRMVEVHTEVANVEPDKHQKARSIDIRDGHLIVFGTDKAEVIAIYAPGRWHHAVVDLSSV